jgi:DNA polymerase-3 subunit epsilon
MLVFLDTETGGLDPLKHSLLQVALVIPDGDSFIELQWDIRHNYYETTPQALAINGIDLDKHHMQATPASDAANEIWNVLDTLHLVDGKILPVGHNIGFDIGFLAKFMLDHGYNLNNLVSYHKIDTVSILQFLRDCGKLPENLMIGSLSLEPICQKLGLVETQTHSALDDARLVRDLYSKLKTLV